MILLFVKIGKPLALLPWNYPLTAQEKHRVVRTRWPSPFAANPLLAG